MQKKVVMLLMMSVFVGFMFASLLLKGAVSESMERRQVAMVSGWKAPVHQMHSGVVADVSLRKARSSTDAADGEAAGSVCGDATCRRVNIWMEQQLHARWFTVNSVLVDPTKRAGGVPKETAEAIASADADAVRDDDHEVYSHIEALCMLHELAAMSTSASESAAAQGTRFVSIPPLPGPPAATEDLGGPNAAIRSSRGYLLLFHGCTHSAKDFCFASPQCPGCRGLPEELRFVAAGLRAGLHVLAVSSSNSNSHCWTSARRGAKMDAGARSDGSSGGTTNGKKQGARRGGADVHWNSPDHLAVLRVLQWAGALADGNRLPIVAAGASSGGAFAASLPALLGPRLVGVVVQIAAGQLLWSNADATTAVGTSMDRLRALRVVYSVMQRDARTTAAARGLATKLAEKRGVHLNAAATAQARWLSAEAGVGFFSKAPSQVHATAFSSRIPFFPEEVSRVLAAELRRASLILDESNGKKSLLLAADPRHSAKAWHNVVRPILDSHLVSTMGKNFSAQAIRSLHDTLQPDKSAISEVLNVLYALHEFFADDAEAMLRFLLDRG